MRKLISSDEAKVVHKQHKTPCQDCPFRRDSLPGWLGGLSAEDLVRIAQSDEIYNCHTKVGPQCAGMAIFRANIAKVPRDPDALRLPSDRKLVFSWGREFIDHHNGTTKTRAETAAATPTIIRSKNTTEQK